MHNMHNLLPVRAVANEDHGRRLAPSRKDALWETLMAAH